MGGLAGHISHLWEDVNLKFSSLLELYSQAQQGKLTATEKFDGLNLCFTASDDLKSLVFARNKTDTKIGGVSKEEIEVLIKFDQDDDKRPDDSLFKQYPFDIKVFVYGTIFSLTNKGL
jgi:hypothetical protein